MNSIVALRYRLRACRMESYLEDTDERLVRRVEAWNYYSSEAIISEVVLSTASYLSLMLRDNIQGNIIINVLILFCIVKIAI